MLGWTFARPTSCKSLLPGLQAVAAALNNGELARAMIATQFLRLPILSRAQARRAADVVMLFKAAADDPKHPGWPAGTAGSLGGEFRPKDGAPEIRPKDNLIETRRLITTHVERRLVRRAVREFLRRVLTWRRLLRLAAEAGSNAVPALDAIGDVAMAADLGDMIQQYVALKSDADIALEFANKGPYTLDQLRADRRYVSFSSFGAFKKIDLIKIYGSAGGGYEWHHIVEQNARGAIPESELQSTWNIIRIPKLLHDEIDSEYASTPYDKGPNIRTSLRGKAFEEKRQQGLKTLRDIGILK